MKKRRVRWGGPQIVLQKTQNKDDARRSKNREVQKASLQKPQPHFGASNLSGDWVVRAPLFAKFHNSGKCHGNGLFENTFLLQSQSLSSVQNEFPAEIRKIRIAKSPEMCAKGQMRSKNPCLARTQELAQDAVTKTTPKPIYIWRFVKTSFANGNPSSIIEKAWKKAQKNCIFKRRCAHPISENAIFLKIPEKGKIHKILSTWIRLFPLWRNKPRGFRKPQATS